jgi:hypothetical protein
MANELTGLGCRSDCHEKDVKDMEDRLTEIECHCDDSGEGLQRTVRSHAEDAHGPVAQKHNEERSFSEQFAELLGELNAKIQELGDLAKVNHDSGQELFENLRTEAKEQSATVRSLVEPSAVIDSSKLANSVRCFKYEVKRLKSITDTEPREQFAAVMSLVKDRIDPSIISELREDFGAAKAGALDNSRD